MAKFKIITDSSCDIPTEIRKEHGIDYYQMGITIDGKENVADMDWKAYSAEELYTWLAAGRKMKTNLITVKTFMNKTKEWFDKGYDVLYLGCSTALTGSLNSFNLAKDMLLPEYPSRKMVAVQTYAAAATLGMMVVDAAREQEKGASLEDVCKWVEEHRFFYNQFCTVDTLSYLKDDAALEECRKNHPGGGYIVGRMKGLGEMSEDEVSETLMDPDKRLIRQITIEDSKKDKDDGENIKIEEIKIGKRTKTKVAFKKQN